MTGRVSAGTPFAPEGGVAHPADIDDDVERDRDTTVRDAVAMIARCARHQHPELFGGREVPAEELPSLSYEAVPPGFNSEGILPDEAAAA
jgi:hypothetical protein